MQGLSPAQIAEIKSAYAAQQAAPPTSASTTPQLNPSQIQEIQQAYKQSLMTPSNIGNQVKSGFQNIKQGNPMPQSDQDALNQLGGLAPAAGNAAYNFVQGAAHPFTPQNTASGIAGQIGLASMVPLGDIGAALRLGRSIPAIGNAIGKAGDFLNPAMASGMPGMIGRSAINSGIGGGLLGAAGSYLNGNNPLSGAGIGGVAGGLLGAAAPVVPEVASAASNFIGLPNVARNLSSASKMAANKFLTGPVKTVQDFISNLTGTDVPNEIANKAVSAVNELKPATQQISNQGFSSLMQKADQMGINGSNPTTVWQTANDLANQSKELVDPKYNQLKNDIQMGQNLFRNPTSINPATGVPTEQPSLQALNNFKIMMNNRAFKTNQDPLAASMYGQLANSAKQEVDNRLANTPLAPELAANNQYFQNHVLPLRNVPDGIEGSGLLNHIQNGVNSDFTKAISPEVNPPGAQLTPIQEAHNQMLQNFAQTKGTSPVNLMKGFVLGNVDNDANKIKPDETIKNYFHLANAPGNAPNTKQYGHLFSPDSVGNPPLITQDDRINMGNLATKAGFFDRPGNLADADYLGAAGMTGSNGLGWVAKNATNILMKFLPHQSQYFQEPSVKNALITGGIPAAENAIKALIKYPVVARNLPANAAGMIGGQKSLQLNG